jgi:hypothetical protein
MPYTTNFTKAATAHMPWTERSSPSHLYFYLASYLLQHKLETEKAKEVEGWLLKCVK